MKKSKLVVLSSLISGVTMLVGIGGQSYALGTASLSMSGGAYQVNSVFSVPIYENSAATDPVNVVQADFSYSSSVLQFQSVNCAGSFGITASAGANSVTCGVAGGATVTGNQLVATASFKALAGSGSTTIAIAPTSHVYRSTDNTDIWNGVTTATGISFTTPAPVVVHSTPAAAAPVASTPASSTTPAATTPKVKAASVSKPVSKQTTAIIVPSTDKHVSAWIYYPVGIIAVLAGIGYVFRTELTKLAKPLSKKLPKTLPVRAR